MNDINFELISTPNHTINVCLYKIHSDELNKWLDDQHITYSYYPRHVAGSTVSALIQHTDGYSTIQFCRNEDSLACMLRFADNLNLENMKYLNDL
jgi:hypothetical protein